MLELFQHSGIFGVLILLLTLGLAAFILAGKPRVGLGLIAALVPLVIGLAGTSIGRAKVEATLSASPGEAAPEEREHGNRQAMATTWIGGAGALLLAFLVAGGAAMRSED